MSRVHYYRVSTDDQSVESQRTALGACDKSFADVGVSGGVLAADRPGWSALTAWVREGDVVAVYAVDRLGRDAIDVQQTVRALLARGVEVEILGLGRIGSGVGELILAVLAQVAQMERQRIRERCEAGRQAARASLEATGKTHNGATSLGRPRVADPAEIRAWRAANSASVSATAEHFGCSDSTVKRACRE